MTTHTTETPRNAYYRAISRTVSTIAGARQARGRVSWKTIARDILRDLELVLYSSPPSVECQAINALFVEGVDVTPEDVSEIRIVRVLSRDTVELCVTVTKDRSAWHVYLEAHVDPYDLRLIDSREC